MKTLKDLEICYYDNSWNKHVRYVAPVTEEALVHFELMNSHYCKLAFKSAENIGIQIGDFVVTPYGRFELVDTTRPTDDGFMFTYDIQFDAYYRKWKNKLFRYLPNSSSPEASFSLTSNIFTHANVIIDNLKYLASISKLFLYDPLFDGEGTDYVISVDDTVDKTKSKAITYSDNNILDALSSIAQTFECEWWVEGNIIHFGTCENTNKIEDLKLGVNIASVSNSQSQNTYANKIFAFGAQRNLPTDYKKDESADITKNGVVQRRLMLPTLAECSEKNKKLLEENNFELTSNGCLQVKGLNEDQYVEGVTSNDDIYPRNIIKASTITSYEKEVEDSTSTDKEKKYIKRTFYRLSGLYLIGEDGEKTGDMAFRSSYILSGQTLHIIFQSGSLNGMDFECQFNPLGEPEVIRDAQGNAILKDGKEQINPASQVFEVVANETYGRFLPDSLLKPKEGDTFVLYNWDASKLGTTLITAASNELLTDAITRLKKSMVDPTTYTCQETADYASAKVFHEGDRVNLYGRLFKGGYRQSRIIGYEFNLDIPFASAKLTVGEKPTYSRLGSIENKVEELTYNGQSYAWNGNGGNAIYIIKSYDTVDATDYNVYSAKRVLDNFLSKVNPDTASGLITFLQGMAVGSGGWNFNKDGVGKLYQMLLSGDHNGVQASNLLSSNFDQAAKTGYWVTDDDGTKYSYMEIDKLYVRYKAVFDELEIRKRTYVGGNAMFSDAASKIVGVEWLDEKGNVTSSIADIKAFKCYLKTDDGTTQTQNLWRVDDLALCQTFNIKEGKYSGVQNKAYWRKVVAVGDDYICLSNVKGEYYGFGVDHTDDAANYGTSAKVVLAGADGVVSDGDVLTDGADGASVPADFPEAEDAIVQCGNTSDPTRQNMIELLTYTPNADSVLYGGGAAPALIQYAGINGFTLNGKAKTVISPSGNVFRAKSFIIELGEGESVHVPLDMGEWKQGTEYPYYARVSHKGELWLLDGITEGWTSKKEPGTTDAWTRQVAKGKDGEGLNVKGTVVEHFRDFADFEANVKEDHRGEETPYFLLVSGRVVDVNSAIIVDSAADYSEDHDGDTQQGTRKPSILTYTNDPIYDWDVAEASEADGYMDADGVLWVAGKTQWTKAGTIKGEKGDKGDDAEWYEVEIRSTSKNQVVESVVTDKDGKAKDVGLIAGLYRHIGSTRKVVSAVDITSWKANIGTTSRLGTINLSGLTIAESQLVVTAAYNGKEYTKSIPIVKDGQTGDKGEDGEDAVDVLISPETLMFDTDDDGNLQTTPQTAYISLRKGGTVLKPETDYTISQNTEGVNVYTDADTVTQEENDYTVTIKPEYIYRYTAEDGTRYPYTDGYVVITVNVGGTLIMTKRVMFRVNYAKYVGKVSWTQKQFSSEFTSFKGTTEGTIKQMQSSITQNADNIKLVVTEDGAKQSGMLISKEGTTLMGDKITVMNDGQTAAMFTDGKLNANLIEVEHIYPTIATTDSDGTKLTVQGHFGIVDDDNRYPLWLGATKENQDNAPARIDINGKAVFANADINGKITSTEGEIGGFKISDSSLVSGGDTSNKMSLSRNSISFNDADNTMHASFGNSTVPSSSGWEPFPLYIEKKKDYRIQTGAYGDSYVGGANIGIYFDVEGHHDYKDGYWGNHALFIQHGDILGFRLRHRRFVTNGETAQLDDMESLVTIYGEGVTLKLPTAPEDGMMIHIRNHSLKDSYIAITNANAEWIEAKSSGVSTYYVKRVVTDRVAILPGRMMILTYDEVNTKWMAQQFMN